MLRLDQVVTTQATSPHYHRSLRRRLLSVGVVLWSNIVGDAWNMVVSVVCWWGGVLQLWQCSRYVQLWRCSRRVKLWRYSRRVKLWRCNRRVQQTCVVVSTQQTWPAMIMQQAWPSVTRQLTRVAVTVQQPPCGTSESNALYPWRCVFKLLPLEDDDAIHYPAHVPFKPNNTSGRERFSSLPQNHYSKWFTSQNRQSFSWWYRAKQETPISLKIRFKEIIVAFNRASVQKADSLAYNVMFMIVLNHRVVSVNYAISYLPSVNWQVAVIIRRKATLAKSWKLMLLTLPYLSRG